MFHGLPYPDRRISLPSPTPRATPPTATRRCSPRRPTPSMDRPTTRVRRNSMLMMGGTKHRRYRALVQPSFLPAKARWWIENWIEETVHALIDSFVDEGRAELNVDFCAAIPVLTITGSFGIPVDQALDVRASLAQPEPSWSSWHRSWRPVVNSRRTT